MTESPSESGVPAPHLDLLAAVPFLSGAEPEELAALAESTLLRQYRAGDTISYQEKYAHSMFIIVSGQVALHARRSDGEVIFLGSLVRPGEFFGEEALLGRGVRMATAVAESQTTLLEVEQRKFALLARRTHGAQETLERIYHQRSVTTFIQTHTYLSKLSPEVAGRVIASARMATFQKDEFACRQGDPADTVMLVVDGVLKAVRATTDGRLSVLAYFNSGEIVGAHDPRQRPYDLVALGKAEVIFISKEVFDQLEFSAPDVYARFGKDRMSRQGMLADAGKTVFGSAEALFQEGMEVESLLIIDLDRCVRCGNCVRACHTRHKYTRLDRRGPIFRRRKSLESKEHEHLLIPSSCRHCRDPECMIGCPTGAIQRFPNGQVEINSNCVGCDNCARKCPYGNITMRPLPPEEQHDNIKKQAIKCNLCRGYSYSNCVHECPRGALLRVNPLEHFDELTLVLAADQDREGHLLSTRRKVPKRASRPMAPLAIAALILLGGSLAMLGAYMRAPKPYTAASATGLTFGVVGALGIFGALMLGARKRLSNHGLGRLETWTQMHMVIGAIGFVAALAHSNFGLHGIATTLLMLLFGLEVLTGITGHLLYSRVPKLLTRLERKGNSKLIEDLYDEQENLSRGVAEILVKQPREVRRLTSWLKRLAGSPTMRYRKSFDSEAHLESRLRALDLPAETLAHRTVIERLLRDYHKLADVESQLRLHRSLKHWLFIHLATSAALTTFLVFHIVTMLPIVL